MTEVNIYKCIGNEIESIPEEVLQELGLSYEELNIYDSNIVTLSKTLKKLKNNSYCRIPFCHTVEAECFGSKVTYDHKFGNRVKEYAIDDLNQIEDLRDFDLTKGRIAEVLKALNILKKDNEKVVVEITGPITVAISILDSSKFFRAVRKDIKKINNLLEIIKDAIVDFIFECIHQGADVVSITDPAGTLDIVGEKLYKDLSGKAIYSILKRVEDKLGDSIIHLCGKTSTSLETVGFIETEEIKVEGMDYFEMIQNIKAHREDVKIIGHWCMKSRINNDKVTVCKLL